MKTRAVGDFIYFSRQSIEDDQQSFEYQSEQYVTAEELPVTVHCVGTHHSNSPYPFVGTFLNQGDHDASVGQLTTVLLTILLAIGIAQPIRHSMIGTARTESLLPNYLREIRMIRIRMTYAFRGE